MMRLSAALQRRGSTLLNQQCWLWGQDVRRTEGNLLLELGFERQRPPAGQQGCTQYTRVGTGAELRVWGFGVYYREGDSGLYLNRYAFAPQHVTLHDAVWTAGEVPDESAVAECSRVVAAARAVADLEQEVQRATGLAYRSRCMAGWTKRSLPPGELVPAWLALARDMEAHAARTPKAVPMQTGLRCVRRPVRAA